MLFSNICDVRYDRFLQPKACAFELEGPFRLPWITLLAW